MAGSGNQSSARVPRPHGTLPNQGNVQIQASGTAPLANANGPVQTISVAQAVEQYIQTLLVDTSFLGIRIRVHGVLAKRLREVEQFLHYDTNHEQHGISTIIGKQGPGAGIHTYGCAIDVNYETSPYLMHESGEAALDATLPPVYNRIAMFILGRASVIPLDITQYNSPAHRNAMYTSLKQESDAMKWYFGVYMRDPNGMLDAYLKSANGADRAKKTSWAGVSAGTAPSAVDALRQMQADWVTLTGRSNGPQIALWSSGTRAARDPCDFGMCYPSAAVYPVQPGYKSAPDAPFVSKGKVIRDPSNGFLNFDHEIVDALCDHGFLWGAVGFGSQSGDVMHFELTELGKEVHAAVKRITSGGS